MMQKMNKREFNVPEKHRELLEEIRETSSQSPGRSSSVSPAKKRRPAASMSPQHKEGRESPKQGHQSENGTEVVSGANVLLTIAYKSERNRAATKQLHDTIFEKSRSSILERRRNNSGPELNYVLSKLLKSYIPDEKLEKQRSGKGVPTIMVPPLEECIHLLGQERVQTVKDDEDYQEHISKQILWLIHELGLSKERAEIWEEQYRELLQEFVSVEEAKSKAVEKQQASEDYARRTMDTLEAEREANATQVIDLNQQVKALREKVFNLLQMQAAMVLGPKGASLDIHAAGAGARFARRHSRRQSVAGTPGAHSLEGTTDPANTKLVVKNLDKTTTVEEIKEAFEQYGQFDTAPQMHKNDKGEFRGVVTVSYAEFASSDKARTAMNNTTFKGRRLEVVQYSEKEVQEPEESTEGSGMGLAFDQQEQYLMEIFTLRQERDAAMKNEGIMKDKLSAAEKDLEVEQKSVERAEMAGRAEVENYKTLLVKARDGHVKQVKSLENRAVEAEYKNKQNEYRIEDLQVQLQDSAARLLSLQKAMLSIPSLQQLMSNSLSDDQAEDVINGLDDLTNVVTNFASKFKKMRPGDSKDVLEGKTDLNNSSELETLKQQTRERKRRMSVKTVEKMNRWTQVEPDLPGFYIPKPESPPLSSISEGKISPSAEEEEEEEMDAVSSRGVESPPQEEEVAIEQVATGDEEKEETVFLDNPTVAVDVQVRGTPLVVENEGSVPAAAEQQGTVSESQPATKQLEKKKSVKAERRVNEPSATIIEETADADTTLKTMKSSKSMIKLDDKASLKKKSSSKKITSEKASPRVGSTGNLKAEKKPAAGGEDSKDSEKSKESEERFHIRLPPPTTVALNSPTIDTQTLEKLSFLQSQNRTLHEDLTDKEEHVLLLKAKVEDKEKLVKDFQDTIVLKEGTIKDLEGKLLNEKKNAAGATEKYNNTFLEFVRVQGEHEASKEAAQAKEDKQNEEILKLKQDLQFALRSDARLFLRGKERIFVENCERTLKTLVSTEGSVTCSICLDQMVHPITLIPCGHLFCERCFFQVNKEKGIPIPIECSRGNYEREHQSEYATLMAKREHMITRGYIRLGPLAIMYCDDCQKQHVEGFVPTKRMEEVVEKLCYVSQMMADIKALTLTRIIALEGENCHDAPPQSTVKLVVGDSTHHSTVEMNTVLEPEEILDEEEDY